MKDILAQGSGINTYIPMSLHVLQLMKDTTEIGLTRNTGFEIQEPAFKIKMNDSL